MYGILNFQSMETGVRGEAMVLAQRLVPVEARSDDVAVTTPPQRMVETHALDRPLVQPPVTRTTVQVRNSIFTQYLALHKFQT